MDKTNLKGRLKRKSHYQTHTTHHAEGISLISLIITIIVIIILAAIVIFSGLGTPDSAQFANFTTQVDNVYQAVLNKFGDLKAKHAIAGHYRTDEQIYIEIAVAHDPNQYATMGTTIVNNDNEGSSIGVSTGIQNIQVESAKNKEHSLGMNLPKVRESNTSWYVTKEGKVFNANGYIYDGKTYFNGSVYQAGELPSNGTSNANRAQAIYDEAISKELNIVTIAPVEGSGDVTAGVNPDAGNNGGGNGGNETPTTTDTYTVTFNSNGGSSVASITGIESGSTISEPTPPTKGTDTFEGWYTDDGTFANAFSFGTAITGNITLYAKWTAVASSTYSLGDEVNFKGTSENFYILADNGTTVTMLAKYRLDTSGTTYVQNTANSGGAVSFGSSNNYSTSTIKTMVEKYATDLGLSASAGRLMTKDEVVGICQGIDSTYSGGSGVSFPSGTPSWLYSTSYWLGSPYGSSYVWRVVNYGTLNYTTPSDAFGLRPVLEVSKSLIQSAT